MAANVRQFLLAESLFSKHWVIKKFVLFALIDVLKWWVDEVDGIAFDPFVLHLFDPIISYHSPDPSSVTAAPIGSLALPASAVSVATLSPISSPYTSLLQQTEDQIPSSLGPFLNLAPPLLDQDDYLLSLGDDQGISDLFDACDFDKMPSLALDDLLCS